MERLPNLTAQQLRAAADLKERIDLLQQKLTALLGGTSPANSNERPGRRKISAAGIARIRAAQKARWAAAKKSEPASKQKRNFSAASRAKLAALTRARWARSKAAGKQTL